MRQRRSQGLATVEFAIVGAAFFVILLGVIEVGRALYTWGTLTEVTRRGARVAVICPVGHSAIARVAIFSDPAEGGGSPVLPGLTTGEVVVSYLDATGNGIADPVAGFGDIRYVRVEVQGYRHTFLVPFLFQLIDAPPFQTTLPRESLGVPREGVGAECFGTPV